MYRRRRRVQESIHFSFDSFLDVVANVIGIIIRLILVAWVGARSYSAAMNYVGESDTEPDPPTPLVSDDPLSPELERMRRELNEAQAKLQSHLTQADRKKLDVEELRNLVGRLTDRRSALDKEVQQVEEQLGKKGLLMQQSSLSMNELRERSQKLLDEMKQIQAQSPPRKALRYHAPVSHEVYADELHFECKAGRVTYVDIPAMMQEVNLTKDDVARLLKTQWTLSRTTAPVGAFKLIYVYERQKDPLTSMGSANPSPNEGFSYGLSEWTVEPISTIRGESIPQALKANSEFRQLVDRLDPKLAVVTFWVYPDSFELFRQLRDHLYERQIEVAGRPLNEENLIRASRGGTASRGQ